MIPGIDISGWQKEIDWDQVAASGLAQFAIMKATEGIDFTDGWFARNWREAKRVGVVRGAYHYARPSENGPEDEAEHFLATVQRVGLEAGDLLVLDMEDTNVAPSANLLEWTLAFLRYVEARAGFKPLLYSGRWYMEPHRLTGSAELAEHGLWLAAYQTTFPATPPPWPFVALWQYTSSGSVPGVSGNCDMDWLNGDSVEQLRLYGLPQSMPPPVPSWKAEILALIDELRQRVELI